MIIFCPFIAISRINRGRAGKHPFTDVFLPPVNSTTKSSYNSLDLVYVFSRTAVPLSTALIVVTIGKKHSLQLDKPRMACKPTMVILVGKAPQAP